MSNQALRSRAEDVIVLLRQMFGDGVAFECIDCHKTNEALTGIAMRLPGCTKVPVAYMDDMPEDASAAEVANIAAAVYQEAIQKVVNGQIPTIPNMDREYILNNVVLQAVSRKRNRQLLREHPHILCLDLAGVFRIPVGEFAKNSLQSMLISNQIAGKFDLTAEELATAARRNTRAKFGVKFINAMAMFGLFVKDRQGVVPFSDVTMDLPGLYTLTNEIQINGAALMLLPDILEEIGKKAGMDYYILPSSIHEVLIAKDDGSLTAKDLKSTVYEGNHTPGIVDPADILSDNVYFYSRKEKTLKIV